MIDYYTALRFKFPKAEFEITKYGSYDGLKWLSRDIVKPSEEDVVRFWAEYKSHVEKTKYKELRRKEYPEISDQLDAIMKWIATENVASVPAELKSIATTCMSVKAKYPKPEDGV